MTEDLQQVKQIKHELVAASDPATAATSARFFKTGPGDYGEGDLFIGVTMPTQRKIARNYLGLSLDELESLLHSPEHEFRMTALLILVEQFKRGDTEQRRRVYDLYLQNTAWINNWDLVDASAEYIVGPWLEQRADKLAVLTRLARAESVWERRIAMLATFHEIKRGDSRAALAIAELLAADEHPLIQKAVGWMLREIGKRCAPEAEEAFLRAHYTRMSRTTLRYAIERFPADKRAAYLAGTF